VLFDGKGQLIAEVENAALCPPASSSPPPSATTTTTPDAPSLLRTSTSITTALLADTAGTGSGSVTYVRADLELYADHDGNHRKLADHVAGAAALP
jgi:hypothetical protein